MKKFFICALLLASLGLPAATLKAAALKVDVKPDTNRKDAITPMWENWMVKDGPQETRSFGNVTVTLRPVGSVGSGLSAGLWKPGYETKATVASDGVMVKDGNKGGALELVFHGLPAGKHSLVTYHNSLTTEPMSSCSILVDGQTKLIHVQPTNRVTSDSSAASAFVEFEASEGKEVVVTIEPEGNAAVDNVILNGFAVDVADPAKLAANPSPAHDDEHAAENPVLTWRPAKSAVSHQLYLGASAVAVAAATASSPEFKGTLKEPKFAAQNLSYLQDYYWRVDEVDEKQNATKGEVWRFGVRHLAFPTAEGYGRFARGGRGGRVIEVTNMGDYDAAKGEAVISGSFREAVEAEGPRTIVFRVSGIIKLKKPCAVHNPYCTIAGQTAPGDGICLANYSSGAYGTHDVIIRFLRFRIGDFAKKAMDGAGLGSCDQCIIDHCSISWSSDEGTSSRGAKNITFQRNIVSEALHHSYHYRASDRTKFETHAFAGSISGNLGSFHHNLLAHCTDRNWSLAGGYDQAGQYAGYLDIRNNVVYNWTGRTTDGGVMQLNYVNNYYKPNPKNQFVKWLLKLDPVGTEHGTPKYFMSGNVMEGFDYEQDNWKAFFNGSELEKLVRSDQPLFESYVTTQSAKETFVNVLADVGAMFPKQDAIDKRVIEEVRTGTTHYIGTKGPSFDPPGKNFAGIIDEPTDVQDAKGSPNFPWPEYRTYNVPVDSDHDGMPDEWENRHGLNPNDASDSQTLGTDGYTNLEIFLNSIVQKE
jgi:hypothetical protein